MVKFGAQRLSIFFSKFYEILYFLALGKILGIQDWILTGRIAAVFDAEDGGCIGGNESRIGACSAG